MSDVITVDGPASSGKSTIGLLFARRINYQFIDSGLIYRVGALLAKRANVSVESASSCARLLDNTKVEFKTEDSSVKVFADDEDVTSFLKTPEIDSLVPIVAAHREVRQVAKKIQRKVGEMQNTVMAGRDIGSEIFPDAKLKFFITASVEARAKRRYNQLVKTHPEIVYQDIESEIESRDNMDSTRAASPMRVPKNGIVVDTSDMTIDQAVEELIKLGKAKNPHLF